MNVFVTGGSGGLGRFVLAALARAGHSLRVLTRTPAALSGLAAVPVPGDLLSPGEWEGSLAGCQSVVHLAALTHSNDADRYFAVNALGTEGLLAAARKAGARRFLLVSTRALGPECGAYGESKALAEEAVRQSGLDWTIARPAEVYGASSAEAITRLADQVLRLPLVPYPADPRALLCPVRAADVAQALATMLERPEALGRTYTLAGPETLTYRQILDRLMARLPARKPLLPVPLALIRLAAWLLALRGEARPALVRDQVPRLVCPKDADFSKAARDLAYAPAPLDHAGADELLGLAPDSAR